jgi:antitoxin HigA-1
MMSQSKMRPVHPGELIWEAALWQIGEQIGLDPDEFVAVCECRAPSTPERADKVGEFLGNGPGIWLRMQEDYDQRVGADR